MEKRENEKTWDDFWATGKIEDYLSYRSCAGNDEEHKKECKTHGTVSGSDGDGAKHNAHIGI